MTHFLDCYGDAWAKRRQGNSGAGKLADDRHEQVHFGTSRLSSYNPASGNSTALKPRLAKQRMRAERGDCFRGQGLGSQEIFGLACRPALWQPSSSLCIGCRDNPPLASDYAEGRITRRTNRRNEPPGDDDVSKRDVCETLTLSMFLQRSDLLLHCFHP